MSETEFWRLTPREVQAIEERKRLADRAENYRAALIAATVVNASPNRRKGSTAVAPEDFLPPEPQPAKRAQTPEEQRAVIEQWKQALKGDRKP